MPLSPKTLLYYSPLSSGGLADYARFQANALAGLGIEVHLLARPDFPSLSSDRFSLKPHLERPAQRHGRIRGKIQGLRELLSAYDQLAGEIQAENYGPC